MAATEIADPVREFLAADVHQLLIGGGPAAAPRGLRLGGERAPAADGRTFDTPDPSTGERLATVAFAGEADVDRAVQAARAAFEPDSDWRKMSAADRGRRIAALAALIESHGDQLAQLESLDNGKPVKFARAVDVAQAAAHLEYFAGWATKIEGDVIPIAARDVLCYTQREPVGV